MKFPKAHLRRLAPENPPSPILNPRVQFRFSTLFGQVSLTFLLDSADRLFTSRIVEALNSPRFAARPWMEARRGKPVNDIWLSQQLRPYGAKSRAIRLDDRVGKGYELTDLQEIIARYVRHSEFDNFEAEHFAGLAPAQNANLKPQFICLDHPSHPFPQSHFPAPIRSGSSPSAIPPLAIHQFHKPLIPLLPMVKNYAAAHRSRARAPLSNLKSPISNPSPFTRCLGQVPPSRALRSPSGAAYM